MNIRLGLIIVIIFLIIALISSIYNYRGQYSYTLDEKNQNVYEFISAIALLIAEIVFILSNIYNF